MMYVHFPTAIGRLKVGSGGFFDRGRELAEAEETDHPVHLERAWPGLPLAADGRVVFGDFVDVINGGADHEQRDQGQNRDDRELREDLTASNSFAFAECSTALKCLAFVPVVAILLDRFLIVKAGVEFARLHLQLSARRRWHNNR